MRPQAWQELAACKDTSIELWFAADNPGGPRRGRGLPGEVVRVTRARAVCAACPVAAQCLDYALEKEVYGVWGGTTEADRRVMRRRLRAA